MPMPEESAVQKDFAYVISMLWIFVKFTPIQVGPFNNSLRVLYNKL